MNDFIGWLLEFLKLIFVRVRRKDWHVEASYEDADRKDSLKLKSKTEYDTSSRD